MLALSESPMISGESRKRLKVFARSLERKGLHKKVLQNLSLVSFLYGRIVEFLTIKHYTEAIHWFPDRDSIMREGKGIIRELANLSFNFRPLPYVAITAGKLTDSTGSIYIKKFNNTCRHT